MDLNLNHRPPNSTHTQQIERRREFRGNVLQLIWKRLTELLLYACRFIGRFVGDASDFLLLSHFLLRSLSSSLFLAVLSSPCGRYLSRVLYFSIFPSCCVRFNHQFGA